MFNARRLRRAGRAACAMILLAVAGSPGPGAAQAPSPPLTLTPCQLSDALGLRSHGARCGRFSRPEDPDDPNGRRVELFVAVVPALTPTPAPDALTVIAGGPGAASTEFYASFAAAFEEVRRRRDIVLVDQRGTGRSNPLDCAFVDPQIGAGDLQEVRQLTRECLQSLEADPRFYTTSVAVADLDAVREALAYRQLDVYGASYGTRVALHYLRRYPQNTRSVILDGVVPAQVPVGAEIATDAQEALDALFARCRADAACGERFPDLSEHFAALEARLLDRPVLLTLADPHTGAPRVLTLTHEHLRVAVRMLSYNSDSMSVLPTMLEAAYAKHYAPLAAEAMMVMETFDEALSYGMHNAVVCTEDVPFFNAFLADDDREALARSYLGEDQVKALEALCEVWPRGLIDDDFKTPVTSDIPVLVLSGTADPVTPPRNGDRAIGTNGEFLSNALHLRVPGQGHGVAATGCLPRLIGEFVADAELDTLNTACVDRIAPVAFFLDFSAPAP